MRSLGGRIMRCLRSGVMNSALTVAGTRVILHGLLWLRELLRAPLRGETLIRAVTVPGGAVIGRSRTIVGSRWARTIIAAIISAGKMAISLPTRIRSRIRSRIASRLAAVSIPAVARVEARRYHRIRIRHAQSVHRIMHPSYSRISAEPAVAVTPKTVVVKKQRIHKQPMNEPVQRPSPTPNPKPDCSAPLNIVRNSTPAPNRIADPPIPPKLLQPP